MLIAIHPDGRLDEAALVDRAKLNGHELHCLDNAAYFTAIRGATPRTRTRSEHASLIEAMAASPGDGRTMIYAVTAAGREAHIRNY